MDESIRDALNKTHLTLPMPRDPDRNRAACDRYVKTFSDAMAGAYKVNVVLISVSVSSLRYGFLSQEYKLWCIARKTNPDEQAQLMMRKYNNRVARPGAGKEIEEDDDGEGTSRVKSKPPPRRPPRTAEEKAADKAAEDKRIAETAAEMTRSFDEFLENRPRSERVGHDQIEEDTGDEEDRVDDAAEDDAAAASAARKAKGKGKKTKKKRKDRSDEN